MDNQERPIKLGIVGNQGAGKTSLILRVAENKFYANLNCGVAVDFRTIKNFKINGKSVNLNIFDIAGLARNSDLAISFIKDASAIVLAFSLPEQAYYQNQENEYQEKLETQIQHWISKIFDNSDINTPVFIVGCKLDKIEDPEQLILAINESLQDILKQCQKINIIENKSKKLIFFPTSSATGAGIDELFQNWVLEASKIQKYNGSALSVNSLTKVVKKNEQCC
ncbi:unnamed protein product [Paramecium pentaurelia]|uniref:Uncharacterized protein n=1 Tax=Paramecium pentaurelia TaxID=43138 RepID=A0A8S1XDY2_9CILI|nr:unnamed protein product [Paramecium pentaurelia]